MGRSKRSVEELSDTTFCRATTAFSHGSNACCRAKNFIDDEHTSSLDPKSAGAIESFIESLKIHDTILLVTHQREQAEKVSDNFIFCNIIR